MGHFKDAAMSAIDRTRMKRIVSRRQKASALPEAGGFHIDGVGQQCSPAEELRCGDAPLHGALDHARANAETGPTQVGRELS
jgi:hypothetical protein